MLSPPKEQQRQEPNLWRNLWFLLGHTPGKTQLRGLGAELRLLQQRGRLHAGRQARQHRGVHQRGRDEPLHGREAGPRERVGHLLSRRCEPGAECAVGEYGWM